jgi:NAD(P)-dependent dehydrogenase (short-subunit alcohol dehydrogenase family)
MTPGRLFDMTGKTALVTGGGSGLGKQFAQTMADAGATVILAARRLKPLEDTASAIRASGGNAYCAVLDVADAVGFEAAFSAISKIAAIDVLINNAGVAAHHSLLEVTEETWDRVMNVNLKGAWLTSRATARLMIARNTPGSIINISSVLGSAVQKGTANYPASKAALTHLTRSMAVEWAKFGIRVNAIAPGYFQTELNTEFVESDQGKSVLKRMPQRRLGNLGELSGALLLLASDASSYMTGSVVTVDGGLSLALV